MLFLIEYDRNRGRLETFKRFDQSERRKAQDARLELELKPNRLGVKHEVAILEAASENAVRRTHRRYFEDLTALINAFLHLMSDDRIYS